MHDFVRLICSLLQKGIFLGIAATAVGGILLAAAYVIFCAKTERKQKFPWFQAMLLLALVGYSAVLLYVTLLRSTNGSGYSVMNLHLFRGWREAWNNFSLQRWLNVLLNIAMFVPLGVLLPLMSHWLKKWYTTPLIGFAVSLTIETVQYVTGRGLFDVDDLFTNTLGCMLGFCLVMTAVRLLDRERRSSGTCLPYLVCLLTFAAAMAGIFGGYHVQEYGNLKEAPAFTANTRGSEWVLKCTLDDSVQAVPVYRTETFDKESCDAFGAEFARKAGITFPDTYYYDNTTIFANHSTGDFLNVFFHDRSYRYRLGTDTFGLEGTQMGEKTLRSMLSKYGISIPEGAVFAYEGDGLHSFTVDMALDGDNMVDGTLWCRCRGDGMLEEVENNLITFSWYKDVPVLTQSQAYDRLCSGRFSPGEYIEYLSPEQIEILSCRLDYRIDTKGFYQPVYVFQAECGGEFPEELVVPGIK